MTDAPTRLATLLAEARARSIASGSRVLISVVERIPGIDPLVAIASSAARALETRMYWARPVDRFALAGFGAAISLVGVGPDRFSHLDEEWTHLQRDAIVDDESSGAPGAGPTLMGGFSFDPQGPRTSRWRDFPAASLALPSIQLATDAGRSWLTTNVVVDASGQTAADLPSLLALRDRIVRQGQDQPVAVPPDGRTFRWREPLAGERWRDTVRAAIAAIRGGSLEKVVLAREERSAIPPRLDVARTLRRLADAHPGCFVFGCWRGESVFVGASPELFVRLEGRDVVASSLAGSMSRGADEADDDALAADLLASGKDRVEHDVVSRALAEGLAELCDDIVLPDGPSILSLPHVHHLHTAVRARLRPEHSLLALVARLHPTPAVGGAPREEALRFIRDRERLDRGWYAAPIGWIQAGRGELAVALRCALIARGEASLFAGCGIVADSDPDAEYTESEVKLLPMKSALSGRLQRVRAGIGAGSAGDGGRVGGAGGAGGGALR